MHRGAGEGVGGRTEGKVFLPSSAPAGAAAGGGPPGPERGPSEGGAGTGPGTSDGVQFGQGALGALRGPPQSGQTAWSTMTTRGVGPAGARGREGLGETSGRGGAAGASKGPGLPPGLRGGGTGPPGEGVRPALDPGRFPEPCPAVRGAAVPSSFLFRNRKEKPTAARSPRPISPNPGRNGTRPGAPGGAGPERGAPDPDGESATWPPTSASDRRLAGRGRPEATPGLPADPAGAWRRGRAEVARRRSNRKAPHSRARRGTARRPRTGPDAAMGGPMLQLRPDRGL